jgi:hypothetical protein
MMSSAQVCCLLNLTTYFGTNLKKHCSDGQYEQLFFKYFPIDTLILEKIYADYVVCSIFWLSLKINSSPVFFVEESQTVAARLCVFLAALHGRGFVSVPVLPAGPAEFPSPDRS